MATFELLLGPPVYGPPPVFFSPRPLLYGREGLTLEITPKTGPPWVASFAPGSGGLSAALYHSDLNVLIPVSQGQGYIIDPAHKTLQGVLPDGIVYLAPNPASIGVIVGSQCGFRLLSRTRSRNVPSDQDWQGLRSVVEEDGVIRGEAFVGSHQAWWQFTLDPTTAEVLETKGIRE